MAPGNAGCRPICGLTCWCLTISGSSRSSRQRPAALYDVINGRYEKGSIILTSDRAPNEWPDVFLDPLLASAGLDRSGDRGSAGYQWRQLSCATAAQNLMLTVPSPWPVLRHLAILSGGAAFEFNALGTVGGPGPHGLPKLGKAVHCGALTTMIWLAGTLRTRRG